MYLERLRFVVCNFSLSLFSFCIDASIECQGFNGVLQSTTRVARILNPSARQPSIATLTKIDHSKFNSYFEKRFDEIRSPFRSIAERVRNQSKLTMETKIVLACFSPILRPSTDAVWARPCGLQPCAAKVCKPSRRASAPLPGACVAGDPSAPFPWHLPAGNCGARRAPCARARRGLTIKPCCCASQIL